jgi:hypothetical protein
VQLPVRSLQLLLLLVVALLLAAHHQVVCDSADLIRQYAHGCCASVTGGFQPTQRWYKHLAGMLSAVLL